MATVDLHQEKSRDARLKNVMLKFFGVVVFLSGVTFIYKLYEFFHDLTDSDGLRFAGSHLLTYVLVAGGFGLLLIYGFMKGHFSDIEKAKYEMLEKEEDYDRQEFGPAGH